MAPNLAPLRTMDLIGKVLTWTDNDFNNKMQVRLNKGNDYVPKSYYKAVKQADMGIPLKYLEETFNWLCDQISFI